MKLTLTTDEGIVVRQWHVSHRPDVKTHKDGLGEDEWNIAHPYPSSFLVAEVIDAIEKGDPA